MENEYLIKVDSVSKKFCRDLKTSLKYGVFDITSSLLSVKQNKEKLRKHEFWAVDNVSFELKRGECIGLIGHNGAGKSTLLKILNGLILPDKGTVTVRGKVGALIELGAGFNPILTGRENIYNNAAILGFSKKEVDKKIDEIIEFSEIGDFIDTPVQNYSSGMKVRLGFSVAAQMEPDVLFIDEVLAVGDLGFRVKCMNRIQQLLRSAAVIFVSHAMPQVSTVSTRLLLMEKGRVKYNDTNLGKGIELYFKKFDVSDQQVITSSSTSLEKFDISNGSLETNAEDVVIMSGGKIYVDFRLKITKPVSKLKFRLGIFNVEYRLIAEVDSDQDEFTCCPDENGLVNVSVEVADLYLRYGKYSIHLHVIDAGSDEKLLRQSDVATFVVSHTLSVGADFLMPSKWGEIKTK